MTSNTAKSAPKAADPPDYEKSVAELAEIVRKLETGDVPLSAAMELWERGEQLAASCTAWLDGAKARIEAARKDPRDEDEVPPDDEP